MNYRRRLELSARIWVVTLCLMTSACAGLTQMQDSLTEFGAGATSVSTTEMTFFNNVQALDCSVQFYRYSADWAMGAAAGYDLTGTCAPQVITSPQLAIRQHILDAITIYAGKMQALASTAGDKTLDTNGLNLANQLNTLASKPGGITKADASIAADVEGALIQLTNMALDQTRYKDAKTAASTMQQYLEAVVRELQSENNAFAASIDSKRGQLELTLRNIVNSVPANDKALRFATVVGSRNILRSANPFGQETLSSVSGIPTPDASKLNSALDGIVNANKAIGATNEGGIAAAVTDLISRAQAAQADEAAITK